MVGSVQCFFARREVWWEKRENYRDEVPDPSSEYFGHWAREGNGAGLEENLQRFPFERHSFSSVLRLLRPGNFTRLSVFIGLTLIFQFELVRPLTVQNVLIGGGIMMIVSFIFIPNVFCAVWVAFSIISIELGVVGYMALWKVNLDSISMINIIMCIGFSVDFTAHICYSYMSSTAKTPNEKMKMALYSLGLPIFQGTSLTTKSWNITRIFLQKEQVLF